MADLPQQEDKLYWKINCDGYYPYCPNCLEEPPYTKGELPPNCPCCGVRLYYKKFNYKKNKREDN